MYAVKGKRSVSVNKSINELCGTIHKYLYLKNAKTAHS